MNEAKTVQEEMGSIDMVLCIRELTSYVRSKVYYLSEKKRGGIEAEDIVSDILLSVLEGKRDWYKYKKRHKGGTFRDFLFGCIKSAVSNFKVGKVMSYNIYEFDDEVHSDRINTVSDRVGYNNYNEQDDYGRI